MTDENNDNTEVKKDVEKKPRPPFITIAVMIALVYFVIQNPDRAKGILIVLVGFGAVIFVHELGHFLAAKAVGIKAEEFAVGFGPVLLGWRKAKNAFQLRLLPQKHENAPSTAAYTMSFPSKSEKAGDTEYQLRAIPLGGFVRMLGQEDMVASKTSNDPRSYMNKSVWQRMFVISAGVIVNVITGFIAFIYVFSNGISLPPAIVGEVIKDMPAAKAGLKPGDEFIAIDGKTDNLGFIDLMLAGAFADSDEKVNFEVKHPDGQVESYEISPEKNELVGVRGFGISKPFSTTLGLVTDEYGLDQLNRIGLKPGDTIIAVNNRPIKWGHELLAALKADPDQGEIDQFELTVERPQTDGATATTLAIHLPGGLTALNKQAEQPLGMHSRLVIDEFVALDAPARVAGAEPGDVILKFGSVQNPTLKEIQRICKNHPNREVEMTVERLDENGGAIEMQLNVTPRTKGSFSFLKKNEAKIGVILSYDNSSTVLADCLEMEEGGDRLNIPRGAAILAVSGQPVTHWCEMAQQFEAHAGQSVEIAYSIPGIDQAVQTVAAQVPDGFVAKVGYVPQDYIARSMPTLLKDYERIYRGDNWRESLKMGADATYSFIAQTYLTIKGMVAGNVSAKAMSGPIGILSMSYTIAKERSAIWFIYFMAMISMCIAVFNFLPIPILDGGHMVMLAAEKIKGSPVSVKAQEVATWVGLGLIGCLFLYVTFNDVMRLVTG
jgi:regulator of sigma E protease